MTNRYVRDGVEITETSKTLNDGTTEVAFDGVIPIVNYRVRITCRIEGNSLMLYYAAVEACVRSVRVHAGLSALP